jgi:hypothetical protein
VLNWLRSILEREGRKNIEDLIPHQGAILDVIDEHGENTPGGSPHYLFD